MPSLPGHSCTGPRSSLSEKLGAAVPGVQEELGAARGAGAGLCCTHWDVTVGDSATAPCPGDLVGICSQSPSPLRSQTSCGSCLALGAVTVTVTAVTHRGGDAASH